MTRLMRHLLVGALTGIVALTTVLLLGGGSTPRITGRGTGHCAVPVGQGTMGACAPRSTKPFRLSPFSAAAGLIPDVSEFQPCALHSEAIFRIYEAGTEREDANAACHEREARRLRVWFAVYAFLRPGHKGCVGQADRVRQLVVSLGGVVGPVIADAEVPLPAGFVTCFVRSLQAHGYVVVIYTGPGTWPGGPFAVRVWVAAYPFRPPCFLNACPYVAHQFSENFLCRGIRGDCSVNEGILRIRQPVAESAKHRHLAELRAAEKELVAIRRLKAAVVAELRHRHCKPHARRTACRLRVGAAYRWHLQGVALDGRIARLKHELG